MPDNSARHVPADRGRPTHKRLTLAVGLVLALVVGCASPIFAEPPNAKSALGINLSGVVDWSSEMPFVDVFKHSREWISQEEGKPWGKGPRLELTAEGWVRRLAPRQYATTLLCVAGGHPPGRYVCLYEGTGQLEFKGNARVVARAPGRIELDVSEQDSMFLDLRQTDPNDPVRNIRVLMPGFEQNYQTNPFYPPFLERYRPFKVIRFMDWMKTNGSKIREWSDRPKSTDATQAKKGVALETMIALSNTLHADPWFCMPHLATDDYVRRFASQVKEQLAPDLRVYVEYSNEVWNRQFEQARYAAELGRQRKLSTNEFQRQLFYYAQRSVEIFRIWEEVFGEQAGKSASPPASGRRLVRVLGSQSANPWVSEQVMTFRDAYRHADAVAIAPYFGYRLGNPKTAGEVARMSLDAIFERCREDLRENEGKIAAVVERAKKLGLEVIAYEAGQHLVGHGGAENNDELTRLFHSANRDPRMKELYLEYLSSWKRAGGRLMVIFSSVSRPSKWGSWGMLEREDQDPKTAPKYQAILDFMRANPRWWE